MNTHVKTREGDIVPATVSRFTTSDITALHDWYAQTSGKPHFDWFLTATKIANKERQGGFYMKLEAAGDIQAMATFTPRSMGLGDHPELYIGTVETAPWNHDRQTRPFAQTFAGMLEAAVHESIRPLCANMA